MVTILVGLALICAVAVVSVTLLGGDGTYRQYGRDCLTILEDPAYCDGSNAWYRITKEKPTSDGCSRGRRKSEDGDRCLEPLHPVEVKISR